MLRARSIIPDSARDLNVVGLVIQPLIRRVRLQSHRERLTHVRPSKPHLLQVSQKGQQPPDTLIRAGVREEVEVLCRVLTWIALDDCRHGSCARSGNMRLLTQRHPQQEPISAAGRLGLCSRHRVQAAQVLVCDRLPLLVHLRAVIVFRTPRVQKVLAQLSSVACQVEEALAKVEDTLHAKTELPDRSGITRLGVQPKGANRPAIARLEPPVIQHPKGRALEQHMVG